MCDRPTDRRTDGGKQRPLRLAGSGLKLIFDVYVHLDIQGKKHKHIGIKL